MDAKTKILLYAAITVVGVGMLWYSFNIPCSINIPGMDISNSLGKLICMMSINSMIPMLAGSVLMMAGLWYGIKEIGDL